MVGIIVSAMVVWWTPIMDAAALIANFIIAVMVLAGVGWFVEGFVTNLIWAKWGYDPNGKWKPIRNSEDVSGVYKVRKWYVDEDNRDAVDGKIREVGIDFIRVRWNDTGTLCKYYYRDLKSATGGDIIYKKI